MRGHIRIVADSDQRTRETGKALAAGLMPGCALAVQCACRKEQHRSALSFVEGRRQPRRQAAGHGRGLRPHRRRSRGTERSLSSGSLKRSKRFCKVAAQRANCEKDDATKPASLFFVIPSLLAAGKRRSPGRDCARRFGVASSMAEDLLLEYCEGVDARGKSRLGPRGHLTSCARFFSSTRPAKTSVSAPRYIARAQAADLLFSRSSIHATGG